MPSDCTAIQFADVNPQSGEVVFAVLSKRKDRLSNYGFGQPGDAPINLSPLPDPQVIGAAAAPTGLTLNAAPLDATDFAGGLYLDPECGGGECPCDVSVSCDIDPATGSDCGCDVDCTI